ncbi:MAG: hypothetical protein ACOH17_00720 [Cellulomonas sp.]
MARPCLTCGSGERRDIEASMLAGTSMQQISARFEISRAALFRHQAHCLRANLLSSLRVSENVGSVDLLEHLTEVLGDLSAARSAAMLTGRTSDVIRAAAATTTVVSVLMDKIGLESTEVVREMREADDLARSVAAVVRASPGLAAPLSAALRLRGQTDAASALDALAAAVADARTLATAQTTTQPSTTTTGAATA